MPELFDCLYPWCSLYATSLAGMAHEAKIDLEPTFWPSAPAIRAHLRPEITTAQRTPHGLQLTCRYSLPTGGANGPLWLIGLSALGMVGNQFSGPVVSAQTLPSSVDLQGQATASSTTPPVASSTSPATPSYGTAPTSGTTTAPIYGASTVPSYGVSSIPATVSAASTAPDNGSRPTSSYGSSNAQPASVGSYGATSTYLSTCAPANPTSPAAPATCIVTVADVIAMARAGVDDGLIINQIRAHGLATSLQASDVIRLHQQGISRDVIAFMQKQPVLTGLVPNSAPTLPSSTVSPPK